MPNIEVSWNITVTYWILSSQISNVFTVDKDTVSEHDTAVLVLHRPSPYTLPWHTGGQLHHSFQLGGLTSRSTPLRSHGGTPGLRRTLGSSSSHPARTPLTDPTGTIGLSVGVNLSQAVFLILISFFPSFLQRQVAPRRPQPLVPLWLWLLLKGAGWPGERLAWPVSTWSIRSLSSLSLRTLGRMPR